MINFLSETIKTYPTLYPTKLPAPFATHKHDQSNYFAFLDEEDLADHVTVMVSNKGKATYDVTASTDEWIDEERIEDENVPWKQSR